MSHTNPLSGSGDPFIQNLDNLNFVVNQDRPAGSNIYDTVAASINNNWDSEFIGTLGGATKVTLNNNTVTYTGALTALLGPSNPQNFSYTVTINYATGRATLSVPGLIGNQQMTFNPVTSEILGLQVPNVNSDSTFDRFSKTFFSQPNQNSWEDFINTYRTTVDDVFNQEANTDNIMSVFDQRIKSANPSYNNNQSAFEQIRDQLINLYLSSFAIVNIDHNPAQASVVIDRQPAINFGDPFAINYPPTYTQIQLFNPITNSFYFISVPVAPGGETLYKSLFDSMISVIDSSDPTLLQTAFPNSYLQIKDPNDPVGQQFFKNAFDHFIQNFPQFTGTNRLGSTMDDFIKTWTEYLSTTALFNQGTGIFANIPSYKDIYEAYLPNGDFAADIQAFASNIQAQEGYFLPSHFIDEWLDSVVNTYISNLPVNTAAPTPTIADLTKSQNVLTMLDVFKIIADLIGVLQKVAATQAQRLRFYADWQKSYTETINNVPIYVRGGGPFSGTDSASSSTRADLNARAQVVIENLRSFRSIIGDEAKQHRTAVNQSNEAVNQQANLATAILQQFSTILQSIFR